MVAIVSDAVTAAFIAAGAAVVVALIGLFGVYIGLKKQLRTGNGHTAGAGIARLEEQSREHQNRLDRLDVRMSEMHMVVRDFIHALKHEDDEE